MVGIARRVGIDDLQKGLVDSWKKRQTALEVAPFFTHSMRQQKQIRMTQLIQAALNGPSMTIEELSDVGNAAMSEFLRACN